MSRVIKWSDDFDVGVQRMNDEHKIIIQLIGELFEKNERNEPFSSVMVTLKELAEYTVKHFKDEEEYMESVNYPQLSVHKKIHEKLLNDLSSHAEKIEQTKSLTQPFFDFLNMWLSAHIKGIDMKYNPESNSELEKAS